MAGEGLMRVEIRWHMHFNVVAGLGTTIHDLRCQYLGTVILTDWPVRSGGKPTDLPNGNPNETAMTVTGEASNSGYLENCRVRPS
jgi:hypothetical protein